MVTPLTWESYRTTIAELAVVAPSNAAYVALLPQMVNYAELRICRDLDFLQTVSSIPGHVLTGGQRALTIPLGTLVTLQNINVIAPPGGIVPLVPVTKEFLDVVYGAPGGGPLPRYFAMLNETVVLVGPWPTINYAVELIGTTRPASLSEANQNTFIATYLPDLFIMASMIWISGYQRNFGRQSDDPQMAVSYESQYMTLLKGAMVEEARKKFQASGWTSMGPPLVASSSRNPPAPGPG